MMSDAAGDAEAEHVDQRVAGVGRFEGDLAADRRDADAVAVAGDAGDDAVEQARCVAGCVERRRSAANSAAQSAARPS